MPRKTLIHPGTFPWTVPFDGPVTFLLKGAGGAGAERTAGTTGNSHVATSSETFTLPVGAFNVSMTAEGRGGSGGGGDAIVGGGGGGGGGKGVTAVGTATSIAITISGGDATGDDGAGHVAIGYHGTDGGASTAGTGGSFSGDSGTNGANGTPTVTTTGGNGGNSGAGSAGGTGGAPGVNGNPGSNFGGGGGGGGAISGGTSGLGGSGGSAAVTITWDSKAGGGGGGGGANAIVTVTATAGDVYTIINKAGGTVGGATAGDCEVKNPGSTVIGRAKPGLTATTKTGAAGGLAASCIGDSATSGGTGGSSNDDKAGGGGGGSGGDLAAGSNGSAGGTTTGGAGGAGGSTDGGAGGKGADMGGVADAGHAPGGGGGGGPANADSAAKDGADSRVDIDWFKPSEWKDSGCFCCETWLPDTFDLYCSGFSLPVGRVEHPEDDPCGFGVTHVSPFMIANGWTKVYNETVYPFNSYGIGTPIVVPVAWKSARMGPFCNGGCYLTIWIWCDRDGEHPFGTAPDGTLYIRPGSWFSMHLFEGCDGTVGGGSPTYSQWPASSFSTVTAGAYVDNTDNWPCDYACVSQLADGRFKVPYDGTGGIGYLLQGLAFFYGIPPGKAPC